MNRPRRVLAPGVGAAGLILAMWALVGCAVGGDDDENSHTLTVFAAASLSGAFSQLAEDFERDHPGVTVRLSFDGSSGLVDQLAGGAPADVFASADPQTMDRAVAEGLVAAEGPDAAAGPGGADPVTFATNVLTLITPPGNPAGVSGLNDSLEGTRLVVCAEGVPCGTATRALAADAGVRLAPVSEESKVTDVLGKVTSGEADAGIVYATDARAAGDEVEQIAIPGARARPNRYQITALGSAGRKADGAAAPGTSLAREFVDAVTGPGGRGVLADHGFGPP